jgi:hypothetical protein
MANYTKSTNFAVKDGLPSGDPQKVVKGTEIDTEFNNIATAIGSKAELSNPQFLGTPFAPTASPGTNTTQIATTAFVTEAIVQTARLPVGSIYINASDATNPSTLLGYGTWVAFGAGRVPVGLDASDASFNVVEKTGGSKDAIVVNHTHTATSTVTDPGHTHNIGGGVIGGSAGGGTLTGSSGSMVSATATTGITVATTNAPTGSSGTNANLQPYITVFMWKRTA